MYTRFLVLGWVVAGVWLLPQMSLAYQATASEVVRLSPTLTMFTITYDIGFLNADVWLPVMATATATYIDSDYLSYTLLPETAVPVGALVMSDEAELTDDLHYYVPRKERATFTLVVFATVPSTGADGTLTVTAFPYNLRKNADPRITTNLLETTALVGYRAAEVSE